MYSVLGHERAVEGSFILGLRTTIQVTNICTKDAREIQVTNKSIFMLLTILTALQFKDSKSYKTFSGPVTIYVTNNLTDNLQIVKTNIVILGIESYILKKVTSSPLSLRPLYQLNYTFVVFHEL
jgi:hypothetical protein